MTEQLTREAFAAQLKTKFRLHAEASQTVEVELVEVVAGSDLETHTRFSAYFRGPAEFCLPQRTYQVEHDAMGAFDLFIVPVRRDEQGFYYEAVFNRLK